MSSSRKHQTFSLSSKGRKADLSGDTMDLLTLGAAFPLSVAQFENDGNVVRKGSVFPFTPSDCESGF